MESDISKTLYHYCSLNTFLSIIKTSSIWLSDVQKSNDYKEMSWFRQHYYEFLLEKYTNTDDKDIKTICEIIFSIAAKDGFDKVPWWLHQAVNDNSQQILNIFQSLRVYSFCLSELSDSLGQWRGYADDGRGVAIGFSYDYFRSIIGRGLRCPVFNFMFGDISYRTDFTSLFERMFLLHDKSKNAEYVLNAMMDLTHASALFKHPSFSEEKEWRIISLMEDYGVTEEMLNFKKFDSVSSDEYKKNFGTPQIDYVVKGADIIPHMEIKLKNLSKAINRIVIGPKCNLLERDVRHILLRFGVLESFDDQNIEVVFSESPYR